MFKITDKSQNYNRGLPFLFIFILLFSIFLLTFSGSPISDDEHLFAAVSQNLVLSGEFRADQLLGNQRVLGHYGNVGPIHLIIGSILYRLVRWTNAVGAVQILYFLSPLYTALTATLIYVYGVLKKYSPRASLAASLAFGLTTIAWPYTQTFYREPLAMLLFFLAFFIFSALFENKIPTRFQTAGWVIFGTLFFLTIVVKIYFMLLIPLFIIRIWSKRKNLFKIELRHFFRKVVVLVILFALVVIIWNVLSLNQFSRFSFSFIETSVNKFLKYNRRLFSLETINHLIAILFSPAKGLFVYSPVLIVSLVALGSKKARARENMLIPVGSLVLFIFVQLYVYYNIWWNISWGTRFLLPIIPVLITAGLPTIESALASGNSVFRGFLLAVLGLGFVIQIEGTAISTSEYLAYIYSQKNVADLGETIWSFTLMPAIQHWKMMFNGQELHYAAARNYQSSPVFAAVMILILIILISWASNNLYLLFQESKPKDWQPNKKLAGMSIVYILIFVPVFMLIAYRTDPIYSLLYDDLKSAVIFLNNETNKTDVIIVDGYQKPAWYHMMNFGRPPTPWYSLPERSENWQSAIDEIFERELSSERIWVMIEDQQNNEQIMLKYFYGFGFTCRNLSFSADNSNSYYSILNCIPNMTAP